MPQMHGHPAGTQYVPSESLRLACKTTCIYSPAPAPVVGSEHNTISELIAMF